MEGKEMQLDICPNQLRQQPRKHGVQIIIIVIIIYNFLKKYEEINKPIQSVNHDWQNNLFKK